MTEASPTVTVVVAFPARSVTEKPAAFAIEGQGVESHAGGHDPSGKLKIREVPQFKGATAL